MSRHGYTTDIRSQMPDHRFLLDEGHHLDHFSMDLLPGTPKARD
jgi:hypothetical protein